MANELVLSNFEEKLPGKVSDDWHHIVIKQELENQSSEAKYLALKEYLVHGKGKVKYQVSKSEMTQGNTPAASTVNIVPKEDKRIK